MLFEKPWDKEEELWEIQWQTFPANTFAQKPITRAKVQGIEPSQPLGKNSRPSSNSTRE